MKRHRIESLLALSAALISLHFGTNGRCFAAEVPKSVELQDPKPTPPESGKYPSALLSFPASGDARYALIVDKKTRTLSVWASEGDHVKPVAEYAVDLGAKAGNKTVEGDRKTPEGIYFLQNSMDGHRLDFETYGERVFTTDYPNLFDRLEKKTGKGIWLHAIPDSKSLKRGSHGCVVVRNKVIEALAQYIEVKQTPLIVLDQVTYLSQSDWQKERARWLNWAKSLESSSPENIQIFNEGQRYVFKVGSKTVYAVRTPSGLEVLSGT